MGAAAGSTLALALLVCGCVFAAMAGPALSLHTRTQALQQTLAGLSATTKTVQVSASWAEFTGALRPERHRASQDLTAGELAASRPARSAAAWRRRRCRSRPGDWAGLSHQAARRHRRRGASAQAAAPPKLEVVYRDPLTGNAQLVAGTYAGQASRPGWWRWRPPRRRPRGSGCTRAAA